jgi:hypothetical protein
MPDSVLDAVIDDMGLTQQAFTDFVRRGMKILPEEAYRSSHWDDPNVLAHMRFKERDIDGKRVMALEEIQSDWHQAGRQRGYKNPQAVSDFVAYSQKLANKYDLNPTQNLSMYATLKNMDPAEVAQYNQLQAAINFQGVADAPFKNNAWVQLVLKRALRYAAENNFDELAWIPGNVQNGKIVNATDNRGDFYDKIVVNAANKLGKKYGATTGRRTVAGPGGERVQLHSLPITPEMRKQILEKGVPLFSVAAGASMIPQDQKKPPGQRPRG